MGRHAALVAGDDSVRIRTKNRLVPSGVIKRAGGFSGLRELIASKGGDTDAILRRFGVDPGSFDDPDSYVSYPAMAKVFDFCSQSFAAPHFGFELGSRQSADVMGPLALLLLTAPTVAEALKLVSLHMRVHAPGARLMIVEDQELVTMFYEILEPHCAMNRQLNELSMAAAFKTMAAIVGPQFALYDVSFAHTRAPEGDRELQHFYRAPIRYGQPASAITFERQFLDREIDSSNPVLLRYAKAQCETLLPAEPQVVDLVASQIRQLMPMGACTLETVARKLSIHPRSLQNRLSAENTEFRDLLKAERQESAKAYLAQTATPIAEVATLLGYSDQTSFTRAFSGWFGLSPKRFRDLQRETIGVGG